MTQPDQAASCIGKEGFTDPARAQKIAVKRKEKAIVYRCRYCSKLHIGGALLKGRKRR